MTSKTIGSATAGNNTGGATADYTSLDSWQAAFSGSDDQTGTIITKVADVQTTQFVVTAAGGFTYLLTADSSTFVNAPTKAAADSRARFSSNSGAGGALYVTGNGWTFEKFAIISRDTFLGWSVQALESSGTNVYRRIVSYTDNTAADSSQYVLSGSATSILDNIAAWTPNGHGIRPGASETVSMYHCSAYVYSGHGGITSASTISPLVSGCIARIDTSDQNGDFNDSGAGWNASSDYNVSHDNTAPGSNSLKSQSGFYTDVSSGSWDLSLTSGTSWNIVNRSGFPSDTDTDIVGTTRPSTGADAGVWQTPTAAAQVFTKSLNISQGVKRAAIY